MSGTTGRPDHRGVGGVSMWTLAAVSSILLVFPSGLSLLYSPQTAIQNRLVYAAETLPLEHPAYWAGCHLGEFESNFRSVEFAGAIEGQGPSPENPCLTISFVGQFTEPSGKSFSFRIGVSYNESCAPWVSPDLIGGVQLHCTENSMQASVTIMVLLTEIPGTPSYVGTAIFAVGAIGLASSAVHLVSRSRRA